MARKSAQQAATIPASAARPQDAQPSASAPARPSSSSTSSTSTYSRTSQDPAAIANAIWQNYLKDTPQRVKLIDVFMGFLVVVAAFQFFYCVLAGNYVRVLRTWAKSTWERGVIADFAVAVQCVPLRL